MTEIDIIKKEGTHHNVIAIIIELDGNDNRDRDSIDTLEECAVQTAQFINDFTPYRSYIDCDYSDPVVGY